MNDPSEQRTEAGVKTRLRRRDLLKVSALVGCGGMVSRTVLPAEAPAQQHGQPAAAGGGGARLTVKDVLDKARERLYPTCRVCPVCNGVACAGESGAIGGAGSGMSFQNNFSALQRVKMAMRNIHDVTKADTTTTIFGRKISLPAVCAPMGPAATRYGKGMQQEEWFDALVGGCVAADTIGAVGDNLTYPIEDVRRNLSVVARYKGQALYNSKPIANSIILKWQTAIEATGTAWVSIDVDSGPKSVEELRELVKAFRVPLVIKGIMTVDDALRCIDAGVGGIAVSNHGGRRQDHTPGTADVLPAIADKVKGKVPILTDGCVQTGTDILKYLALGADIVMVGRHMLRAAYGGGVEGVTLFMNRLRDELQRAMVLTGVPSIAKINRSILA